MDSKTGRVETQYWPRYKRIQSIVLPATATASAAAGSSSAAPRELPLVPWYKETPSQYCATP
eukprot:895423-Rhodomonas_salina.1